ncbi:hypothetical protein EON65_11320 [archaeon]|nr:MAG: hypothetical protein EON65_11320 [archaeon]
MYVCHTRSGGSRPNHPPPPLLTCTYPLLSHCIYSDDLLSLIKHNINAHHLYRMAVEDWIRSGYPFHILRDHVNHCIVMNGGMWGGVKGGLGVEGGMQKLVEDWDARNEYMADLHFLEERVWPIVKHKQIAHDSYCCDRYPHTRPYPTKRYMDYQHVGQVFDELDRPRLTDIDGFIRGVPVPSSCRKQSDWIYG